MKTRPIKELLIILRDNLGKSLKEQYIGGMCDSIGYLSINDVEEQILYKYLKDNKPRNAYIRAIKFKKKIDRNNFYLDLHWWTPKSLPPPTSLA